MWPDNETTNDLIGFKVHADLIRRVVTNPQMLPTTIGVFGDWGGGKTSIMKMLERDLDPDNWPTEAPENLDYQSVAVVYANTWQFEGYDDAKAAIISSVLKELARHKRFGPKVRDASVRLLKRVNWMRFAKLTLKNVAVPAAAAFFTGGVAAIPTAIAASSGIGKLLEHKKDESGDGKSDDSKLLKESEPESDEADIGTFREHFAKMLTDGGISTLVVLVDDLDRCTPERIIENLEAVKLFLSANQTAFVIGADRRIVEHAIRDKYAQQSTEPEDREKEDQLVKDYLEKLVQIPYSLPRLSATEIQTYMTLLFCQRHLDSETFKSCLSACESARTKNRYGSFGYADVKVTLNNVEPKEPLKEALAFTSSAAPLIADGLKGNPRQVKRFLNALLLRKELATVANLENIRDAVLVKLMILEYSSVDLFTKLFALQSQQNGHPKEINELELFLTSGKDDEGYKDAATKLSPEWDSPKVRRWIAMEPQLRDVNLRDYFWIARDRLESTFAGIAMIPPAVRRVLDGLMSGVAPKRNSAMTAAKVLSAEETTSLVHALDQRIMRQPDESLGYEALRYLIEAGVLEARSQLVDILSKRPLDKVPATIGMQISTLCKTKPEHLVAFESVFAAMAKSSSTVGKAYKDSIKKLT